MTWAVLSDRQRSSYIARGVALARRHVPIIRRVAAELANVVQIDPFARPSGGNRLVMVTAAL
jgi:hypothetical protein